MSPSVFWFLDAGNDETLGRLTWPASKKRQGTRSREVWHPAVQRVLWDLMLVAISMVDAAPARSDVHARMQVSPGDCNGHLGGHTEFINGRLVRWRNEAMRAGQPISRITLAYEAGRDGFWLARWLIAGGIEAHVIHSASVAVSRERKRAKTDRLDAAMLMRVFLGWLRGERGHCGMVAIPTMEEEKDARRPGRERESLVDERSRITNRMKSALARLRIRGFKPHLQGA